MILPSKYELVKSSSLVTAAAILQILLAEGEMELFNLFGKIENPLSLDSYFDILTFLYILDIITLNNNIIAIKK